MYPQVDDLIADQGFVRSALIILVIVSFSVEAILCVRQVRNRSQNLLPIMISLIASTMVFMVAYVIISIMSTMAGMTVEEPEVHFLRLLPYLFETTVPWILGGFAVLFTQFWMWSVAAYLREGCEPN
jgi:hydrogenase-4 membrane subunit HyfE